MSDSRLAKLGLIAILALAIGIRVHNLGFGLPSLWDDDEPFFLMFGVKLITQQTLNPGWFGHPGTITIYLLALTDIATYLVGMVAGAWTTPGEFVQAAYAQPALMMIPSRLTIVVPAVMSVWLTYRIGKRLADEPVGLLAAFILALSPLHIDLSQVIRTDIQMTFFFLLALNASLPLLERYDRRALIWSAIFTGLAGATKWPGLLALAVPAALLLRLEMPGFQWLKRSALAGAVAVTALLTASPFIVLDYRRFLDSVLIEGRSTHLSQTGDGFLPNLWMYLGDVVPTALSLPGAVLAAFGFFIAVRRYPAMHRTILLPFVMLLLLVSLQHIRWARWAIPFIPLLAILAALGLATIARAIASRWSFSNKSITITLAFVLAIPLARDAAASARERSNDTRDEAIRWLAANAPADKSIAVETPAIVLLRGPWPLRYPLGDLGCVDPRAAMASGVNYDDVSKGTKKRMNINLGTIGSSTIESCKADYLMVNELDRYWAERDRYPEEIATYRALLAGTDQVAVFTPYPGRSGGSVVRIFRRR